MSAMRLTVRRLPELFRGFGLTDPGELRYPALASIWFRWTVMGACLVEVSYRVEYGALSHILNSLYVLSLMAAAGYVWWRIRATGRVDPRWLLALSAIEFAAFAFTLSMSGGFDSRYLAMYYFAVAVFALVFTSPWLVFSYTTAMAAAYASLCLVVGDGVDFGRMEEKELFYRLLGMYGVALSVNLVTRFERTHRLAAVERERELHRQRVEISQTIHDTTAQWAYMTGLGIQGAMEVADGSNDALMARLRVVGDLSRSAMWDLRHPIDGGQIFRGEELGLVLEAHAATFTTISSVPAELVQKGKDPPMSTINRSLLFSIAHNALTNVMRHAQAQRVVIILDYSDGQVRLSVSDDGIGLPPDYEARGHGFRNMRADARRMGGELEVQSNGEGGGTTVTCVVPLEAAIGEE